MSIIYRIKAALAALFGSAHPPLPEFGPSDQLLISAPATAIKREQRDAIQESLERQLNAGRRAVLLPPGMKFIAIGRGGARASAPPVHCGGPDFGQAHDLADAVMECIESFEASTGREVKTLEMVRIEVTTVGDTKRKFVRDVLIELEPIDGLPEPRPAPPMPPAPPTKP